MKEAVPGFRLLLLPRKLRLLGYFLIVIAVGLFTSRFYLDIKPAWLHAKVFAIYSSYLESKMMVLITNQLLEELAALFLVSGLLMVAFAEENTEDELTNKIRLKSFLLTTYIMTVLYTAALAFLYGFGFIISMLTAPFLYLFVYIITFRFMLYRYYKRSN